MNILKNKQLNAESYSAFNIKLKNKHNLSIGAPYLCIPMHEFGVQMGNSDEIRASRVCRDFCSQLAEIDVVVDFFFSLRN